MSTDGSPRKTGGYLRSASCFDFAFNVPLAAFLLLLSAPLFLIICLVILIREGRPIFYSGMRLGLNKHPFQMYKFRTLLKGAEDKLGAQLLGNNRQLITRTGKFLRDTRLDELPQLWNVVKRDMDLVGPRPVRPRVYEALCREIPGYDKRFSVRPGLIGFSQLFTPHSAPKNIRALIDNRLLKKKEKFLWDAYALFFTALLMLRSIFKFVGKGMFSRFIPEKILRKYSEKRRYDRVPQSKTRVYLAGTSSNGAGEYIGTVQDINPEAFLLRTRRELDNRLPALLKLKVDVRRTGGLSRKRKTARCEGRIFRKLQAPGGDWEYVISYSHVSPFNFYLIHQYFLMESIA